MLRPLGGLDQGPACLIEHFTRDDLAEYFRLLGFSRGAEIGVAEGKYSEVLCKAIPGLKLYCVDPWRHYAGNSRGRCDEKQEIHFGFAQQRLQPYNVTFMRMMSAEAAPQLLTQSLDFVYIDGNHAHDYVLQDLSLWWPKIRAGGILAGHDYYEFKGAGVIPAVQEFTRLEGIAHWWLTDAKVLQSATRGPYKEHSFFWFKP